MPRIYVGTYAKYNSGSIAGAWLDLEDYSDAEEFHAACLALHADESDPELMFQDHEDIPRALVSESHLSAEVWAWLELDEDERELLAVYQEDIDQSGTIEQAREAFCGKYESAADYAQELTEECGDPIPEHLANYINWESMARDMGHDGYNFVERGYRDVWVFRPV